jgi:hypothetical protein
MVHRHCNSNMKFVVYGSLRINELMECDMLHQWVCGECDILH